MRPRVLIDIAPLGFAHRRKSYARGIHRVALGTVLGLLHADECDLRFVATSSLHGAYEWLKENGFSPTEKLACSGWQLWLSRWADRAS